MKDSKNMQANTVKAENQLGANKYVSICNRGGKIKVLFFGNSITRHGPKADIGWMGDWGMAASCKENDYVHLVVSELEKRYGAVDYCIAQGAEWERNYSKTDAVLEEHYQAARDFAADIVIIRIGENIKTEDHEKLNCRPYLDKAVKFLSGNAAIVVLTDLFYDSEKNSVFGEVADECGYKFVHLTDLEKDERTMAIGQYEHDGVAHHPSDFGMKCIADRIMSVFG